MFPQSERLNLYEVLWRITFKLFVAFIIILAMNAQSTLRTMAWWVSAYAFLSAAFALLRRERFNRHSFNYWDEALWLASLAAVLHVAVFVTASAYSS